jgi:hypothetical protein
VSSSRQLPRAVAACLDTLTDVVADALTRDAAELTPERIGEITTRLATDATAAATNLYLEAYQEGRAGAPPPALELSVTLAYLDAVAAACGRRVPPRPTAEEVVIALGARGVVADPLAVWDACRATRLPLSSTPDDPPP